jgi:hypothetical protein
MVGTTAHIEPGAAGHGFGRRLQGASNLLRAAIASVDPASRGDIVVLLPEFVHQALYHDFARNFPIVMPNWTPDLTLQVAGVSYRVEAGT